MDLWLWSLCFLPVAGALRNLPEVKLEGILGSSITIECPLPQKHVRLYLCREVAESGVCSTVVSSKNFVKEEYKHRVTLKPYPDQNVFLVEVTELTKSDSGVYACGTGMNTDRGKTQQVTLSVHSATPPAQRTEAPPATHPSPTTQISHHLQVSRASSVAVTKPPTFLPSTTTTSKTSTPGVLRRLQTASYNYHSRLHRQRAFHQGPVSGMEDQGFHILVPTALSLILLALVGLLVKRAIQRRKALSRRVRRVAVRMRALEASQRPPQQRRRASQPPRSQNIYSACPRRARAADAAGEREAPLAGPGASAPPAAPQVMETLWLHAPSLKTSCEYVSLYYKPVAKAEDTDSDDYVNIPCLTHLSHCPPGPRPWCQ
ncbi:fas apoptotic inhibitory molecule 3 isoform X2 [Acinonyx jubatus]|uniref:Fas apoptotic inhibitory molecule 3 isoform X2 n=1 Tax=Acinonyx jubatus TaxID=32536 RepID=A0ABM3P0K1_ACIJB|nr:fas apoptotic inhibitory molecule 3 isoform X2 [Acinonyx jubatus]